MEFYHERLLRLQKEELCYWFVDKLIDAEIMDVREACAFVEVDVQEFRRYKQGIDSERFELYSEKIKRWEKHAIVDRLVGRGCLDVEVACSVVKNLTVEVHKYFKEELEDDEELKKEYELFKERIGLA